jgi:hypothetical protein
MDINSLDFDSDDFIPEVPQKFANIRKSNRFLQATVLTLLLINHRNGIVRGKLMLQKRLCLFQQPFHKMHTPKPLYFAEIFLFENIHYNNLYNVKKYSLKYFFWHQRTSDIC